MLYESPNGKVHSSEVDLDSCVVMRNNARTNFQALNEISVDEYESGQDCNNCADEIRKEINQAPPKAAATNTEQPAEAELDVENYQEDDDWEDEDDFVVDPEKKTAVEQELGILDAEMAILRWEHIAERTRSATGRGFWETKAKTLRAAIEFIPASEKASEPQPKLPVEDSDGKAKESGPEAEKSTPARRKPVKKATAAATK
ncbi:hypothetical protein [Streptomyces rimosus]|uniref:hypothetical protein n=1 Tax=Streptomyces rimosus TaxID=1927 RepID=UPI0004C28E84|nr:hypothetical protein [Streptomyces rimosus]